MDQSHPHPHPRTCRAVHRVGQLLQLLQLLQLCSRCACPGPGLGSLSLIPKCMATALPRVPPRRAGDFFSRPHLLHSCALLLPWLLRRPALSSERVASRKQDCRSESMPSRSADLSKTCMQRVSNTMTTGLESAMNTALELWGNLRRFFFRWSSHPKCDNSNLLLHFVAIINALKV